jgi:hypothetical protein
LKTRILPKNQVLASLKPIQSLAVSVPDRRHDRRTLFALFESDDVHFDIDIFRQS